MMKNDALRALAAGLLDGGCEYATNFPGFHSHELFSLLGGERISVDEKIAYQIAFGASLGGKRSVATFKNVGLNVASDPYLNSILSGVNAGVVVVVTDDTEVRGSQSRQDSRHYSDFFGGLWLEPNTVEMTYKMGYHSFSWSECLDVPIVIRLTNQFFHLKGNYERTVTKVGKVGVASNPEKFIVHPTNWRAQKKSLESKNLKIKRFVDDLYKQWKIAPNNMSHERGVITFGNCHKELALYDNSWDFFHAITYPIPEGEVRRFVKDKSVLHVLEQGDPYGRDLIDSYTSSGSKDTVIRSNTGRVPRLDGSYRVWRDLSKLFQALKSQSPGFVVSDLTQFTREDTDTIQACLCLGSSISIGIGLAEAGVEFPFCVVGDVSFLHGNLSALREAKVRSVGLGVIIVDNGGAWCTGGQPPAFRVDLKGFADNYSEVSYEGFSISDFSSLFSAMESDKNRLSVVKVAV